MAGLLDRGTETLVAGSFAPEQVAAELIGRPFYPGPDLAWEIDLEWDLRLREAEARGAEFFDGELARLVDCELREGVLQLRLQRTSYKAFVGTNLRDTSLPDHLRADPLGNSAVVVTADGKIIVGRRSEAVFGHPGWYHCIGGHIDPDLHADGRVVDTFRAVTDEVTEELNVMADELEEIVCLGVIRDAASRQPEQLFAVRLRREAHELLARGGEHESLFPIDDTPEEVERFLGESGDKTVPVARAALRMHAGLEDSQEEQAPPKQG